MVGGQAADVGAPPTGLDALLSIHARKTGALLRASAVCGAVAAGADDAAVEAFGAYGVGVGLAFQLADDLLDADDDGPSAVRFLGAAEVASRADAAASSAIASLGRLATPRLEALARAAARRAA
jgi:hypothetical protein